MNTQKIDFQKITSEILETGITEAALAVDAQCSQPQINALKNGARGKRLSYDIAKRLVEIHRERCQHPA